MENNTEASNNSFRSNEEEVVFSDVLKCEVNISNKNLDKYNSTIPRIILASGREETCVHKIFDYIKSKFIKAEEMAALHSIFKENIEGHNQRGFIMLDTTEQEQTITISESVGFHSRIGRPLYFIYSGIDTQWKEMGVDLMRIHIFARAIERCRKVLEPKGIDVVKIISEPDKTIFDNILNVFVGIGAVQIGLTDILKEMELEPDFIIGGCFLDQMANAYYNNTVTAEDCVSFIYNQGKIAFETNKNNGTTQSDRDSNTVFPITEDVIKCIPFNAVVVEIGPHGLLQPLLQKTHPECVYVPLMTRNCKDSVNFLLDAIGKLYKAGYNPKVDILYPKVEFSISTKTSLFSQLEESQNEELRPRCKIESEDGRPLVSRDIIISIYDDDYCFKVNHVIDGNTTIPEAAFIVYVWETLAMYIGVEFQNLSVIFKDIKYHSFNQSIFECNTIINLSVTIEKRNGKFKVCYDKTLLVNGAVQSEDTFQFQEMSSPQLDDFDDIRLNSEDIYKIFKMRGYFYKGVFKSIYSLNINNSNAFVNWTNNWVTFIDSLIQLNTLTRNHDGISKPKFISKLKICTSEQKRAKQLLLDDKSCYTAWWDKDLGITRCAGVEVSDILYEDKPTLITQPDILQKLSFFPYFATEEIDNKTAVEVIIQIIAENANTKYIDVIRSSTSNATVFNDIQKISNYLPELTFNIKSEKFDVDINEKPNITVDHTNVLVLENLMEDHIKMRKYHDLISEEDFIISLESNVPKQTEIKGYFNILTCMSNAKKIFLLLRKLNKRSEILCYPVTMEHNFSWTLRVNGELMTTKKVVLVSERQPYSGLLGYVKKMKKNGNKNVALMSIIDFHAPPFNYHNKFYEDQIEKNLCINVLKKSQFGGYYYTSCARLANARNFTLKNANTIPAGTNKLTWVESPSCSTKNSLVQVSFSGFTFDQYRKSKNQECLAELNGMDFSGIDTDGDRVMGLISDEAMSSTVNADSDFLWPVPDHWSLEDAATVPLPYVLAYYSLVLNGKIKKEQRVLISGCSGGLEQALISLCLAFNCTIFINVAEEKTKTTLKKLFPHLTDKNLLQCEQDELYNLVMQNTQTKGCDLVVSVSTGSLRKEAIKCVGSKGTFLDFTKTEIYNCVDIRISYFTHGRSYHAIDLSNIYKTECARDKMMLHQYISEGISQGIVKPLTRIVFSPNTISRALSLMSSGINIDRVLIRLRDPEIMSQGLKVLPRLTYTPQDVVVVVCSDNSLGVELANKIVARGAKKIIIQMKPNLVSGFEHATFLSWSKRKVSVKLCTENLHAEQGCASLMKNAMKFGKVKELFIIQDGKSDDNGDKNDFISVFNKKCSVVLNLDSASRICTELRHFTIIAHSTQNATDEYALALTERVCELRNEMGLTSLVIRCELLADFYESYYSHGNVEPQSLSTFFNALETSLKLKYRSVLTLNIRRNQDIGTDSDVSSLKYN